MVIYVPRAKREQKPVYINNDLFGGCYRRDWEGDYHCSKAEIKGMLRDAADETEDMKIVEQFDMAKMVNCILLQQVCLCLVRNIILSESSQSIS